MKVVRIADRGPDGFLSFDLQDILVALGPRAIQSHWRASGVEADVPGYPVVERDEIWGTGEGADELDELAQSRARVTGDHLLKTAKKVDQIIWGEFKGYDTEQSAEPWVIVIAFDSTWFEVRSTDDGVLARLRLSFTDVTAVV